MTTASPTSTMTTASPTIPAAIGDRSTGRTRTRDLGALPGALQHEWIKLSTLRSNKLILAATAVIGLVTAWALAMSSTNEALTASELFIFPLPLVAMLAAVTGILMFTSEAQHGTLGLTLAARPARWVIVSAKAAMAVAVGLALGATGMIAGYGGAALGGAELGGGSAVASRALWALLYIALAALIGLGVGMIVRHSSGAISGLLMWSFVVESLFAPTLPDGVVHALPFSAGYRLLDAGPAFEPPVEIATQLGRPQYALIFGGYAVLSLIVGTFLLARRDTA